MSLVKFSVSKVFLTRFTLELLLNFISCNNRVSFSDRVQFDGVLLVLLS